MNECSPFSSGQGTGLPLVISSRLGGSDLAASNGSSLLALRRDVTASHSLVESLLSVHSSLNSAAWAGGIVFHSLIVLPSEVIE